MMQTDPAPASLLRRIAALFYDALLLAGLVMVLTLVLVMVRGGDAIPPGSWWFGMVLLGVNFLFFGYPWTHGGQTLGARAWRLRVTAMDGGGLDWRQAALRYLAAWLLLLPPGLGLLWARWDRDALCWHDRLSGTRLLQTPHRQPAPESGSRASVPSKTPAR